MFDTKLYPLAPLESVRTIEQGLENKIKGMNCFNISDISPEQMILSFKNENRKSTINETVLNI